MATVVVVVVVVVVVIFAVVFDKIERNEETAHCASLTRAA